MSSCWRIVPLLLLLQDHFPWDQAVILLVRPVCLPFTVHQQEDIFVRNIFWCCFTFPNYEICLIRTLNEKKWPPMLERFGVSPLQTKLSYYLPFSTHCVFSPFFSIKAQILPNAIPQFKTKRDERERDGGFFLDFRNPDKEWKVEIGWEEEFRWLGLEAGISERIDMEEQ